MGRFVSTTLPMSPIPTDNLLSDSPELEVEFWKYNTFHTDGQDGAPPAIVPVSSVVCQVARGVCSLTKPHLWATTTLQRVRTVLYNTFISH